MAYRPADPGNKSFFSQIEDSAGGLSLQKNTGNTGNNWEQAAAVDQIIIDDKVIALLIESTVLGGLVWFALSDTWRPDGGDPTPVFFASELPALRQKTPEQLRSIFNVKRAFGGGMVQQ